MDLCRHLRWKTFSRDDGDPAAIEASLTRDMVPYSCLRTCQAWGPDDDIVAPECCASGRACFERDRLSAAPSPSDPSDSPRASLDAGEPTGTTTSSKPIL